MPQDGVPAAARDALRLTFAGDVRALADAVGNAPTLAERFRAAVEPSGAPRDVALPAPPVHANLQDALADLAAGAGFRLDGAAIAGMALPPSLEAPVLDLARAAIQAERLRALAFAGVGAQDAAYLREAVLHPERIAEARFLDLAPRVDRQALDAAAELLLAAVDRDAPLLGDAVPASAAPAVALAGDPGCGAGFPAPSLVSLPPLLAVGGPAAEGFGADYILSIDLGGNDVYCNNAGGTFSGVGFASPFFAPVAVALDLGGDDTYNPTRSQVFGVEGAGVLGVGVLVDGAGNDHYHSSVTACVASLSWLAGYATVASQGAGFLGAGVLADVGAVRVGTAYGNWYNSYNTAPCDYGVLFSQGSGVAGSGMLLDEAGASHGSAFNSRNTQHTDYLVDTSQGAGLLAGEGRLFAFHANDTFNSVNGAGGCGGGNLASSPCVRAYRVQCSQGAGGFCGTQPRIDIPPVVGLNGITGGSGILARAFDGNDDYNGGNTGYTNYLAYVVQGAAGGWPLNMGGAGAFLDQGGSNGYNSGNTVDEYAAKVSQGAAEGLVGTGIFLSFLSTGDALNSFNRVAGSVTIDLVQGAATGTLSKGKLLKLTDRYVQGDNYNSGNTETTASITRMQGFADPTDIGLMGDSNPVTASDSFNVNNNPGPVTITNGLAYSAQGGTSLFSHIGGGDTYNTNPFLLLLRDVHAVAASGSAKFFEIGLPNPAGTLPPWIPPDTYAALTFPFKACSGAAVVFLDTWDGADATPLPLAGGPPACVDI